MSAFILYPFRRSDPGVSRGHRPIRGARPPRWRRPPRGESRAKWLAAPVTIPRPPFLSVGRKPTRRRGPRHRPRGGKRVGPGDESLASAWGYRTPADGDDGGFLPPARRVCAAAARSGPRRVAPAQPSACRRLGDGNGPYLEDHHPRPGAKNRPKGLPRTLVHPRVEDVPAAQTL